MTQTHGLDEEMRWGKEIVCTHVELGTQVLEVERALPDIDTNDGDVREERVLVGGGGNVKALVLGSGPDTRVVSKKTGHLSSLTHEPVIASLSGPSYSVPLQPLPSNDAGARDVPPASRHPRSR